jgi:mono/diheme cytochrome c family protein
MPSQRMTIWAGTAVLLLLIAGGIAVWILMPKGKRADPTDPAQVALGRSIYAEHCATCHGANLEGQPNWRETKPDGRFPAPPHDASGHTWHHPANMLFGITKHGIAAYAPKGYQSDMPAFEGVLTDEQIWAALAFIASSWPADIQGRWEGLPAQPES